MTYKQCLKPWAVARLLPQGKWVIIGRYYSRNDADGHLQLLRQRVPVLKIDAETRGRGDAEREIFITSL